MGDTWTVIDDRLTAMKPLTDRMDVTRDLIYMEDFELKQFDGKTKLDKVINVTGNKGATFGHRVIENLASYKWQTVVEGEITKREAHDIEQFLNANLDQVNIYLTENYDGMPDLYTFWCKHICNRGRIGVQYVSWIEKGEYKIHCLPVDMRWTPYVLNKWVAPITWRSKGDLEEELEKYERKAKEGRGKYTKVSLKDTDNEVRDYWGTKDNELWVEKQLAFTQKHDIKKPPFVIVVAPSGFMLRDKGYNEHEGEDIYFLIRKLDKELNRTLSVEQTFAYRQLYPAYEYETKEYDNKTADAAPKTGETRKRRMGELHQIVPTGDMNRASQIARQDILRMMDEGTPMQPRAYTQPPSAIEVATEVELINQLQYSRVTALQMGMAQLYRLMIDQFIIAGAKHKGGLEIGGRGRRKQFLVAQLKDPDKYSISCRLMTKNKKLEIVNEARAMALWGRAPLKYILRDILMVEDPDGWMRELEIEKAKQANPAISLADMAVRYAEEAEDIDDVADKALKNWQSKMLVHDYVMIMRQRIAQVGEPKVEEPKPNSQGLISLLGRGIGGRQAEEIIE